MQRDKRSQVHLAKKGKCLRTQTTNTQELYNTGSLRQCDIGIHKDKQPNEGKECSKQTHNIQSPDL